MNETPAAGRAAKGSVRVPAVLGGGIDADIARVIERAQAEGLTLTGGGWPAARHDQAGGGGGDERRDDRPLGL